MAKRNVVRDVEPTNVVTVAIAQDVVLYVRGHRRCRRVLDLPHVSFTPAAVKLVEVDVLLPLLAVCPRLEVGLAACVFVLPDSGRSECCGLIRCFAVVRVAGYPAITGLIFRRSSQDFVGHVLYFQPIDPVTPEEPSP